MSGLYGTPVIAPAAINTIQIENGDGSTIFGVVTGEETVLTATADDVKIGKIAVTDSGVVEGENTITYRTQQANRAIFPGEDFVIPLKQYDQYDYTKFQCIICDYNTSINDSVSANKVAINDAIYDVNSVTAVSSITKNNETKSINLNISNNGDTIQIIRYFTYKEEE